MDFSHLKPNFSVAIHSSKNKSKNLRENVKRLKRETRVVGQARSKSLGYLK